MASAEIQSPNMPGLSDEDSEPFISDEPLSKTGFSPDAIPEEGSDVYHEEGDGTLLRTSGPDAGRGVAPVGSEDNYYPDSLGVLVSGAENDRLTDEVSQSQQALIIRLKNIIFQLQNLQAIDPQIWEDRKSAIEQVLGELERHISNLPQN